jgi:hypothetical protein
MGARRRSWISLSRRSALVELIHEGASRSMAMSR